MRKPLRWVWSDHRDVRFKGRTVERHPGTPGGRKTLGDELRSIIAAAEAAKGNGKCAICRNLK